MLGMVFGHKLINAQQQFGRLQDVVETGVEQLDCLITEFARMRMHSSRATLCATVPHLRSRGSALPLEICQIIVEFATPQLPVFEGVALTVLNVTNMPLPTTNRGGYQFEDWRAWVDIHREDIIQHTRLLQTRRWRLRLMRLRVQAFVTATRLFNSQPMIFRV